MRRLVVLLLLICCSFTTGKTPEKCYRSFQHWYTAHQDELTVQRTKNELSFELRYLPNEVTICQQILRETSVSKKQLRALYAAHDAYAEFSFRILDPNSDNLLIARSEDKADFQNKQFYLIEAVQQDFYLVRNTDTLSPLQCQFENNYGTAPFITLHLAFEKAPAGSTTDQLRLLYNDQLFGSDTLVFDLSPIKNLQIPKIQ